MPALDGWRAISILLVLISHGGLGHIIPGGLGVTIFFFISGFLITSLLISELQTSENVSLGKFYLRRFWRLSPPLLIYVTISIVYIYIIQGELNLHEVFSAIFYFANYYSIYWHFESLPFAPSPLKILWSLAIEEHYYLFFAPLLAFFAYTPRKLFHLILLLIITPIIIRCYLVFFVSSTFDYAGYTYMSTETRIDSIAWGGMLAWICRCYPALEIKRLLDNKFAVGLSIAIILICLAIRDERFRESIRYSLQGIAFIPLFYATLYGSTMQWFRKILASKVAVTIGKLSYSIYLYHWLALVLASWLIGNDRLSPYWMLWYYGLTICLAIASYKLIEIPTLIIRKKYGSHATS